MTERTIKVTLLDGSIVTMNTEERVISYQLAEQMIPLTTDADSVFDDVLAALEEAQQTIARQQQKIDAALSWTWNCGEANMLEVIAALKGKEQTVLTFPNCPICNSNNTLAHPNKAGTWLCVPCDKVFEEGGTQP